MTEPTFEQSPIDPPAPVDCLGGGGDPDNPIVTD